FGFPVPAMAAALLVYLSPVVGVDGASAYNDVAAAFVVFAVFYLLELWRESPEPGLLVPIGLLAGFAFGIKYTAFLALPFALAVVAGRLRRERRELVRAVLVVAGTASLMIAPWMLKNLVTVGNPVAPFFKLWFPNPSVFIEFEDTYQMYMRSYGLADHRLIPIEATARGAALQGFIGPIFLLSPLALLALGRERGRRLLVAGAVFALPYFGNIGTRFLIPCLPFFALALALALGRSGRIAALLVAMHALLSWPANTRWYTEPDAWRIQRVPIRAALRLESEHDYLSFRLPEYGVARMIEELVPPEGKVFAISFAAEGYTTREILVGYQFARGNT
ncbi:MAG: glycosyltransferase family 39 protein, partial [Acidobacteriota bacterium]